MKSRASHGNVPGVLKRRGRPGTGKTSPVVYNETKQALRTHVTHKMLRSYQERFVAARKSKWRGSKLLLRLRGLLTKITVWSKR